VLVSIDWSHDDSWIECATTGYANFEQGKTKVKIGYATVVHINLK